MQRQCYFSKALKKKEKEEKRCIQSNSQVSFVPLKNFPSNPKVPFQQTARCNSGQKKSFVLGMAGILTFLQENNYPGNTSNSIINCLPGVSVSCSGTGGPSRGKAPSSEWLIPNSCPSRCVLCQSWLVPTGQGDNSTALRASTSLGSFSLFCLKQCFSF